MPPARPVAAAVGAALIAATVFAATATAQNTTKSSSTNSCPSQQTVMTSDWYGSSNGYLCAQEYHAGNQSIDAGSSQTFSQDTNVAYFPQYYCWTSSDDKDVSYAHAEIFGSGSVTATNFGSGSHVWGAGYLYTLGSGSVTGWTNGCYDNAQVWQNPPNLLRISSITANNLPDNGASKAGASYSVKVSVTPASDAAGAQVALEDNGTAVAGGVLDSNGNATITWSPTIMGSRTIQVGWPGANGVLGNITDPYTVNVSGGVAVQVAQPVVNGNGTATATVSVQTTPDPWPTGASVTIINAATKKAIATPVALTAPTDGSLSNSYDVTFQYTPGTRYTLVGQVLNSSNTGIGGSYAIKFNAPSTVTATIPSTAYPSMDFGGVTSCNPVSIPVGIVPATGTGYAYINAAFGAVVDDGAATVNWCPPTTTGSVTLTPSYGGDAATSPGAGAAQVVTVQSGGPQLSMSSISQQTGSTTVKFKVDTVNIPDGQTVTLLQDGKSKATSAVSGGVATFSLSSGSQQHTYSASYVGGAQTFYSNQKGFPENSSFERKGAFEMERTAAGEMARAPKRPKPAGNRGTADPGALQPTLTGALSVTRSMKVTSKRRTTTLSCRKGTFPLHTQGSTSGDNTEIGVAISGRRVIFTSPGDNVGETMYTQVTCRKNSAGATVIGPKGYGTRKDDTLRTQVPNGTVLAGPGRDRIIVTGRNSSAWGGQGADRILLRGNGSTAAGGPGDDRITASGPGRMLAWGGPGRDTLVGGSGNTLLNARDGKGGDTVICRSSSNRVMLDAGDTTRGPCRLVTPG